MKKWMMDAIFLAYIIIVLPFLSLIYFGYALTNFEILVALIGGIIFYLIFIPYPVYWYLKNRVTD